MGTVSYNHELALMHQFSSVTQLCPTLCDPMGCSTPGLPVHHQILEFTQAHVHWVSDAIQPSHPLSSPSPPAFNLSQHQGLFQWVSSSHHVAKVSDIGVSASHQSLSPKVLSLQQEFSLGIVRFMGFDKSVMTYTYHCSVIPDTVLKVLCALPTHPSLSPTPGKQWSFHCLHSFPFPRISYSGNHSL